MGKKLKKMIMLKMCLQIGNKSKIQFNPFKDVQKIL